MDAVTLKSYAKVNLTLDVMAPRPDGYHDIRSIMQTISLHDTLIIKKGTDGAISVSCDYPGVPSDERNLAYRAAVLVQEAGRLSCGVDITIRKSIPVQAGLGGGSSNGAAALLGLNRLFDMGLDQEELIKLAGRLGSDAPFFMIGGTALAEGRGERLMRLDDAPDMHFLVVKPDAGVSTPWAYAQLDKVYERAPDDATTQMLLALEKGGVRDVCKTVANDFEQVVLPVFPVIDRIKGRLIELGAECAALAGSGAAVFAVFIDEHMAMEVSEQMKEFGQSFTARSIRRQEVEEPWQ